jgi:hypothetical protein
LTQAATTAASVAAYDLVGRKMVKPEDITEKAKEAIKNIISSYKSALTKIFVTDSHDELYEKINAIVDEYLDRFNSVEMQFATGVPTNVASHLMTGFPAEYGLGGLFQTAVSLTQGIIKNAEAMPEIVSRTKAAIEEVAAKAPTKWDMLKKQLAEIFQGEAGLLENVIITQGYVDNGDIACSELGSLNLEDAKLGYGSVEGYRNDVIDICNMVDAALRGDYDFTLFENNFIGLVSGAITHIRKDIAHTGSQGLSSVVVNLIDKGIKKVIDKSKEQQKREKELAEVLEKQLKLAKEEVELKATVIAHQEENKPTETESPGSTRLHMAKPGETLFDIAKT